MINLLERQSSESASKAARRELTHDLSANENRSHAGPVLAAGGRARGARRRPARRLRTERTGRGAIAGQAPGRHERLPGPVRRRARGRCPHPRGGPRSAGRGAARTRTHPPGRRRRRGRRSRRLPGRLPAGGRPRRRLLGRPPRPRHRPGRPPRPRRATGGRERGAPCRAAARGAGPPLLARPDAARRRGGRCRRPPGPGGAGGRRRVQRACRRAARRADRPGRRPAGGAGVLPEQEPGDGARGVRLLRLAATGCTRSA